MILLYFISIKFIARNFVIVILVFEFIEQRGVEAIKQFKK